MASNFSPSDVAILGTLKAQPAASLGEVAVETKLAPSEVRDVAQRLTQAGLVKQGGHGLRLTNSGRAAVSGWQEVLDHYRSAQPSSVEAVEEALDEELNRLSGQEASTSLAHVR